MPQRNEQVGVTRADIDHDALSKSHGEAYKAMGGTFEFIAQAEKREKAMAAGNRAYLDEKYPSLGKRGRGRSI